MFKWSIQETRVFDKGVLDRLLSLRHTESELVGEGGDQPNAFALISRISEEEESACETLGNVPPMCHSTSYCGFSETSWTVQQAQMAIAWTVSPVIYFSDHFNTGTFKAF